MTVMLTEVYDALRDAGVAEDKARKAAEALATHEPRFAALERKMDAGFAAVDTRFAKVEGDLNLLKWMSGTSIVLSLGVLARLFASQTSPAP